MIIKSVVQTKKIISDMLSSNKEVAVFLGAGASKCQGFPLIKELSKITFNQLSPSSREMVDYIMSNTPILLFCNVEHVLGILLTFEQIGSFTENQLNNAIIEIKKQIFIQCKGLPKENYHYTFFREIIAHRTYGGPIDIFTTNYDILIEHALDKMGALYTTGVTGVFNRHWFGGSLFDSVLLSNQSKIKDKDTLIPFIHFRVVKLHGSISWYYDRNMVIHEMTDLNNVNFDIKKTPIIYPSIEKGGKFLYQKPYNELSKYFKKRLEKTPINLMFFGYSFGDEHLNSIIFNAMKVNTEISIYIFCNSVANLKIPDISIPDSVQNEIRDSTQHHIICDEISWKFEHAGTLIEELELPGRPSNRVDSYSDPYAVAEIVPNQINWPESYGLREKKYLRKGTVI